MEQTPSHEQNIEERADELINSFRNSFWIKEHQWFVRCFIQTRTIYLHTLSEIFSYSKNRFPHSLKSNDLHYDHQEFYNKITTSYDERLFHQPIPSHIRLANIKDLHIELPINDQFWSIVPNLNQLNSLRVVSYADNFQSQMQALLEHAPNLDCLNICQNVLLPLQISLFQCTNGSVRQLYLQGCNYYFNEDECIRLCHSPLGIQCEVLSIRVNNRECIIYLVKNMKNLRSLRIQCEDEKNYKQLSLDKNDNDKYVDGKMENEDEVVKWLKDHLPSMCLVFRVPDYIKDILIWI
ncbi:unnamed protein product [Rotaria sp. Silwood2]|nr:unnamed protein product [Rotaria sp. Silwood2]